jgi:hypothetical protein
VVELFEARKPRETAVISGTLSVNCLERC